MFNKKEKLPVHLREELSLRAQFLIFAWEVTKVVVISLCIIVPIRHFLIKPFYVKGASMEPTFYDHEYLIIDEISYRFNEPSRGESVVFRYPLEPSQHFIKRIIGLPGEKISIAGGIVTIINNDNPRGVVLDEPYLDTDIKTGGDILVTLGEDEYFLLGDNRTASLDSRAFGPVKRHFIVGKTLLRGWPLDRIGLLSGPFEYNL